MKLSYTYTYKLQVHFLNLSISMQYTENVLVVNMKCFNGKNDIFLIFAQNIDCGYKLEPPRFFCYVFNTWLGIPLHTPFFYIKVGIKGVNIARSDMFS